ncbi:MAG: hypothetical protein QXI16_00090 [Sulfolobaceae archaeon]
MKRKSIKAVMKKASKLRKEGYSPREALKMAWRDHRKRRKRRK